MSCKRNVTNVQTFVELPFLSDFLFQWHNRKYFCSLIDGVIKPNRHNFCNFCVEVHRHVYVATVDIRRHCVVINLFCHSNFLWNHFLTQKAKHQNTVGTKVQIRIQASIRFFTNLIGVVVQFGKRSWRSMFMKIEIESTHFALSEKCIGRKYAFYWIVMVIWSFTD